MNQTTILFPMMALVGWTFAVLLLIPYKRFRAAFDKQVAVDDFKLGESENVPPGVRLPNRNLMNLFEMPVLFYLACLTLYVTQSADSAMLSLAWAYVALRIAHSAVHLTYNNVFHRLALFAISNIALLIVWVRIATALSK